MSTLEIVVDCRYGKECEYINKNDGKLHRCNAYQKIEGTDHLGNKCDRWDCVDSIIPLLLVQVAQTNRGQTEAIVSFREETVKRQNIALALQARGDLDAKVIDH